MADRWRRWVPGAARGRAEAIRVRAKAIRSPGQGVPIPGRSRARIRVRADPAHGEMLLGQCAEFLLGRASAGARRKPGQISAPDFRCCSTQILFGAFLTGPARQAGLWVNPETEEPGEGLNSATQIGH